MSSLFEFIKKAPCQKDIKIAKYKLVSEKEDRYAGWQKFSNYNHTRKDSAVAVVLSEISALVHHYPLVFAKVSDKDFRFVALLGLYDEENLFLDPEGKWHSSYIPAKYRSYPFSITEIVTNNEVQKVLAIDLDSNLYRDSPEKELGESRFFSDDGKIAPVVESTFNFLQKLNNDGRITQKAVEQIVSYDILVPLKLNLNFTDETRTPLKGLYRIDEQKLHSLTGDKIKVLQERHALGMAYAHIFSLSRISILKKFYEIKQRYLSLKEEHEQINQIDNIDAFFNSDDEELSFDWNKL